MTHCFERQPHQPHTWKELLIGKPNLITHYCDGKGKPMKKNKPPKE